METRTIDQTRIWKLMLNPMEGSAEGLRIVAYSTDKEKLINWYNGEKVEPYDDDRFRKMFRKGSILEWYNGANVNSDELDLFGHGIGDEWCSIEDLETSGIFEVV